MAERGERDTLRAFVRDARERGAGDAAIERILRYEGWSDRKIAQAMAAEDLERIGVAAPERGGRAESAREAFLYLLSFAFLGTWAVGLIWLGDLIVDRAFHDPLAYSQFSYTASDMAGQLATVIVAFPLYMLINWLLAREIAQRPEALESGVRKWLTYVALAIAACTIAGDAVWFLTAFLSGGLSTQLFAKMALLVAIAGGIFWYYLVTIRADRAYPLFSNGFAIAATALVAAFVFAGFSNIGSPAHERRIMADDRRVEDLQELQGTIGGWWTAHRALPRSLSDLPSGPKTDLLGHDYDYRVTGAQSYRLCAVFDGPSEPSGAPYQTFDWSHPAGYHCYSLRV